MPTCIPTPIAWNPNYGIRILDQTLLPLEESYRDLQTVDEVAEAIRKLRVRGAPLIGIAAAMGLVQAARQMSGTGGEDQLAVIRSACETLGGTRPTAVNLHWAL